MVSCILSKPLYRSIKTTYMVCNHVNEDNRLLAKTKINTIIFSNISLLFSFLTFEYFITFRLRKLFIFKYLNTIKTTYMVLKTTYMVS